jgi:hypothetical protein
LVGDERMEGKRGVLSEVKKCSKINSDVAVHTCNPSPQAVETEKSKFQANLGYTVRSCLKNHNRPGEVVPCDSDALGSIPSTTKQIKQPVKKNQGFCPGHPTWAGQAVQGATWAETCCPPSSSRSQRSAERRSRASTRTRSALQTQNAVPSAGPVEQGLWESGGLGP